MPVTPLATAFLLLKLTCLVLTLFHPFYVGKAPAKKGRKAKNAAAVQRSALPGVHPPKAAAQGVIF